MDLLGNLRVVLFLPEDVALIGGPPALRRRYLDITLCQVDSRYCRTLATYNKILEQRNAMLRRIAESGSSRDMLPIYTDQLVEAGSQLFSRRALFMSALARETSRIHYEELTHRRESARLSYLPRLDPNGVKGPDELVAKTATLAADWIQQSDVAQVAQRFAEGLAIAQDADLARGSTTLGPHRDDWRFWLNSRELGAFGSRGQQRTAILALKLGEIRWMIAETGDTPVLLLDEVVAELDEQRRALLLAHVRDASQAIVTATDPRMFTAEFLRQSTAMIVSSGRVQLAAVHPS
jgi:DNA replication and repair protein RecF